MEGFPKKDEWKSVSTGDDKSRTVWHIPLVVDIPLLRWSVGPFITAPFIYPNMDHEALLKLKDTANIQPFSERRMRDIALLPDRQSQLKAFAELRQHLGSAAIP